jgi:Site-specific recombinases, DNA invertase Pin homologs
MLVGGTPNRPRAQHSAAGSLTAQRDGLAAFGVAINRVYVDHGLTGTNRERPGLREALAARLEGDTVVVTKLDRLARPAGCCSTCSRWSPSSSPT